MLPPAGVRTGQTENEKVNTRSFPQATWTRRQIHPRWRLRSIGLVVALCVFAAPRADAALSCVPLSLREAKLRFGSASNGDRLSLRGEFALSPGQAIDPAAETVVLTLLDRGGTVFRVAIAPGSFRADAATRSWRFADPSGLQARGLRQMRFFSPDGLRFRWKAQARDTDLSAANEVDLEVVLAVGGDCARAVEPCRRGAKGRLLSCRAPSPDAPAAQIEATTRGRNGPLPGVIRVGILGWNPDAPWAMLQQYAPVARQGQVRVYTLDPSYYFDRTSTTPPSPAQWQAAEEQVRAWAREVKALAAAGYQPTTQFCCMPRWLSSRPADESVHPNGNWLLAWAYSPPADLSQWYDLVYRFVSVIASEGLHLPYQVWDEPDWSFYGTLEDYFDLYQVTASAIRAADPLALVGGPGLSGYGTAKASGWATPQNAPVGAPLFLPAWIAEMGRRAAPIDFVDWHFPTADPQDGRIDSMVQNVRTWLEAAGYDAASVPVRIGEWLKDNCGQGAADLPSAAQILPMLTRFADAGVTWHTHTSFTDQSNWSDGCWTHVGLLSGGAQHPRFVVRAKLNVFRLVSWLGEVRLAAVRRDPFVQAIVTQSSTGYAVLLANAVSTTSTLRAVRRAVGELCATGVLATAGCDALADCWAAMLANTTVPPPGWTQGCFAAAVAPEELDPIAPRAAEILSAATARQGVDWFGTVRIVGLRGGTYEVERALVDRTHGNVCAYNKATEPVPSEDTCGAGGAVDQAWAGVVAGAEEAARGELRARGYTDGEIATIETELIEACRLTSSTREAFLACIDAGIPALATQIGRDAGAMTVDLHAAFAVYDATLEEGEVAAAAALNALPQVTSQLEPAGQVEVAAGRLDLQVSLPPDGVMLLRLRRVR